MRIFPLALIALGVFGVLKHFGLIPIGMFHLIGPLLLIAIGVALLLRHPRRCRNDWRARNGGDSTNTPQPPSPGLV